MISIKDSMLLAKVKFRQRKVRFILTSGAISIGVIIIAVIILSTSGFLSLLRTLTKDSLANRYIASERFDLHSIAQGDGDVGQFPTVEEYIEQNQEFDIQKVYLGRTVVYLPDSVETGTTEEPVLGAESRDIAVPIPPTEEGSDTSLSYGFGIDEINDTYTTSLYYSDPIFIQDYLFDGYSLEDKYDGKIPIVVPVSVVVGYYGGQESSEDRFNRVTKAINEIKGKTYQLKALALDYSFTKSGQIEKADVVDLGVQVIIVGVVPDSSFFPVSGEASYNISMPEWAFEDQKLTDLNRNLNAVTYISEFSSKAERDDFVQVSYEGSGYGFAETGSAGFYTYREARLSAYEAAAEPIKWIRRIGYGIGGFFVAMSSLFVMFTLGKMISDSRKEIGMFRAVGATKRDIKYIFLIYGFWLIVGGFLVGIFSALLFCIAISLLWGDNLFYSIVLFSTNFSYDKPAMLFVGFPPFQIFLLFIITTGSGLLASLIPARRASKVDPIVVLKGE